MTARALILCAGRGERLRPLTDATPKPLLAVGGRPLVEWHLLALARAGVREVVVNAAWLQQQFPAALGDGARFGLSIRYSMEGTALETAGGIASALPLLAPNGDESFWVVSGDVFAPGFAFDDAARQRFDAGSALGRLWLVPNPPYKPQGDFALGPGGLLSRAGPRDWTYANAALLRPAIVDGVAAGTFAPLAPCLFAAAGAGRLEGQPLGGVWHNVGTAADLSGARAAAAWHDGSRMQAIATPLCRLEPQLAAHAAEMFEVLSDPAIDAFENAPPPDVEWLAQRFARLESRRSADGSELWLNWVVRLPGGELAGYVQATVKRSGVAFVAYELASRFWHRGIGSAAVRAMLDALQSDYGVSSAVAVFKTGNVRSRALLKRLGFAPVDRVQAAAHGAGDDESAMVLHRILTAS